MQGEGEGGLGKQKIIMMGRSGEKDTLLGASGENRTARKEL